MIEKLGARLGRGAVYCLDTASEHRPERAWERLGAGKEVVSSRPWRDSGDSPTPGPAVRWPGVDSARPWASPLGTAHVQKRSGRFCHREIAPPALFLDPARPLDLLLNRPRPVWLLPEPLLLPTHNHRPQLRGPLRFPHPCERIESGWWDGNDVSRDYFMAVNVAGERFWIFRDRRSPTTWYLHGIFA